MSIRSKLFATVALPVLSVSVAVPPAAADSLMKPFEVAQEGGGQQSEEELLLLKKRQAEEEAARQAAEQQKAAEEEAARQAAEQQKAAEEEAARQAAEQQKAAEEEAARQAAEQQKAAEEEAARQAAEQQKAAEEEAARQAAEQQKAAEEEAARQAAEQQKAAEEEAARQAAEQQKAAEEEAARQAAEQQKAAEEEAARQAAEQQKAAEEEAARQAAEQQKAAEEQQKAAEEAQPGTCVEGQDASGACPPAGGEATGEQPAPEGGKAAEQPATTEEQKAGEQPPATEEQKAGEQPPVTEEQKAGEQPATTEEQKAGGETAPAVEPQPQTGEGQPVPGTEQPATAEQQPQVQQPAPEVVDTRSEEEKLKIAEDPAATDETVVLPIENGAAVLDSDKDADNVGGNQAREQRQKLRQELRAKEEEAPPPADDAAAQAAIAAEIPADLPQKIEANLTEEGTRVEEVPVFAVPETTNIVNNTVINNTVINNTTVNNVTEVNVVEEVDNRVILGVGDQIFVRGDDRPRLRHDAEETFYDQLPRGRVRETIVRPGGYRIVTIYNRYGDILQRSRVDRDGNEYLMIYAPERDEGPRPAIIDVGYELPPMRLRIPVSDYIADVSDDPDRDYYEFLAEPPVERVERVYTIDEVRHSARLRDKVRRIDLDTITFPTGSAEVSMSQAKTMRKVAAAMEKVLAKDPGETFFIEGHTDAVGSDRSNLVLSDKRAESVASLLTEVYGIPPENLVTQGYGERFLKVRTQEAEQQNRRVTIRRVTPLVRPVAQR